jgi:hypothetical protein
LFEYALEWYKDPQIMLERCKMLIKLGESSEYIETLLGAVEEVDPENRDLAKVKEELYSAVETDKDYMSAESGIDYTAYESYKDHIYTLYDCIIPARNGSGGSLKLLLVLLAFNIILGAVMYITNSAVFLNYGISILLLSIMEIMMLLLVPRAKNHYVSIYYHLYSQISNMKKERYNKWFLSSLYKMFGHITPDAKRVPRFRRKNEKVFIAVSSIFVVVWSFGQVYLYALPPGIALPMLLIGIPFWSVAAYAVRMMLMTTLFISSFSKLSLNPAISESNNQGFVSILSGFLKTFKMFMFFLPFFILYFIFVNPSSHSNDLFSTGFSVVGFSAITIIIFIWSVMVPLQIRKSAKNAQLNCLLRYQTHTIDAFNAFIKDPNDIRKRKLEWLLSAERDLRRMTSSIIKFKQTVFIIFANLWAVFCSLTLASYNFGLLDKWFSKLF